MLRFYRRLTGMGLSVELTTNDYDAAAVSRTSSDKGR